MKAVIPRIIKVILDVVYLIQILMLIFISLAVFSNYKQILNGNLIDLTFVVYPDVLPEIDLGKVCEGCGETVLTNAKYYVSIDDANRSTYILLGGYMLVSMIFYMGIVVILRNIFRDIIKGNPFIKKNIIRIRIISILVLVMVFSELILSMIANALFFENIQPVGYTISTDIEFDWNAFTLGLIIMVIAEIFNRGNHLQELENQTV